MPQQDQLSIVEFPHSGFLVPLSVGVVQGMITGIRGLCNGLGPALYGFVFYLFHVELTDTDGSEKGAKSNMANPTDEVRVHICKRQIAGFSKCHHVLLSLCTTLTNVFPSECHHPRSSLPVWCMLSAAVSSGGPVYPRAHGAWHEAWCIQEAQQRSTESLSQPSGQWS